MTVDMGVLGVIFGGLAAVAAVITVWLVVRYRRTDSIKRFRSLAETLVRDCERRRVLWNRVAWENPDRSHGSVLDLRQAVGKTRGELPSSAPGVAQLEIMKGALEAFCDRYEGQNPENVDQVIEELIEDLRGAFIPALEEFRELYGVPAGHRPTRNPWIDPIAIINVPPPVADDGPPSPERSREE